MVSFSSGLEEAIMTTMATRVWSADMGHVGIRLYKPLLMLMCRKICDSWASGETQEWPIPCPVGGRGKKFYNFA